MAIRNTGVYVLHSALASGTPEGTYLYGPATVPTAITTIILCNNTGSDITVSLYAVQAGLTPYDNPEVTIASELNIPAGDSVSFDQEKFVLDVGDSIQATASYGWNFGVGVGATVSTLAV